MSRIGLTPNDGIALLGLVLLTIGVGMAWLPGAFIVPGGLLIAYALLPDQPTEPRIEP